MCDDGCSCNFVVVPNVTWYRHDGSIKTPAYATSGSACWDMQASFTSMPQDEVREDAQGRFVVIGSRPTLVGSGLAAVIPQGYVMELFVRSGLALNRGLMLHNSVGIIDSDYRNEIKYILSAPTPTKIYEHERIAQGRLAPVLQAQHNMTYVEPTNFGDRKGGFGSTGVGV